MPWLLGVSGLFLAGTAFTDKIMDFFKAGEPVAGNPPASDIINKTLPISTVILIGGVLYYLYGRKK